MGLDSFRPQFGPVPWGLMGPWGLARDASVAVGTICQDGALGGLQLDLKTIYPWKQEHSGTSRLVKGLSLSLCLV